jgi:uracil phosphoribosyltransferase
MFIPTQYPNVSKLSGNISKYLCSILRDQNTSRKDFIAASDRLSTLLLEGVLGEEEMVTEVRISGCGAK